MTKKRCRLEDSQDLKRKSEKLHFKLKVMFLTPCHSEKDSKVKTQKKIIEPHGCGAGELSTK